MSFVGVQMEVDLQVKSCVNQIVQTVYVGHLEADYM
jgi:hypothetical protein